MYSLGVSDPMLRFPATPSWVPSSPVSPPPSSLPVSPAAVPLSGRSRSGQQWQLPDWNVGTGTEGLEHWNKLEVNTSTHLLEVRSWLDGVESPLLLQSQHCDDAGLAGVERFAGEPKVLGAPVKVETSALVVAGSSNHEKKREHVSETSHLGWNYLPAGPLGIAMT